MDPDFIECTYCKYIPISKSVRAVKFWSVKGLNIRVTCTSHNSIPLAHGWNEISKEEYLVKLVHSH